MRRSAYFTDRERGVLAQFRHQHFLLFLIAHFQKAALLMFSERLVEALKRLHVADPASVRRFKRAIRASFEGFLRFTHRYWFHDIAEQAQTRALFRMTTAHLGTDALYAEVKERTADMNGYLDADSLRRQANTVVRLTVVTIFGLIGTITTGFLGMNLLAEAESPLSRAPGSISGWCSRCRRADAVHHGQVEAPVGLPRRGVGRAPVDLEQARGARRGVASRHGLSGPATAATPAAAASPRRAPASPRPQAA
jgi:hypothetical protein